METEETNIRKIIDKLICVPIIVGLIFNTISLVVFSRKTFQNTIFSTFFRCLCVSDIITLLFRIEYLFNYEVADFRSNSIHLCKIIYYFVYMIPSFSIWVLVVISIDRFLSIVYPTRFLFRKLKRNQILALFLVFIFQSIYWLPVPFLAYISINNGTTNETVSYYCEYGTITVDIMDLFYSSLFPLFLMFISTSLTLKTIFRSRMKSQNNHQQQNQSAIKPKDIKFAISSISLNVFFFIFNIPLTVYSLIHNFFKLESEFKELLYSVCELLFHVNYSTLFFVSYYFNSIFRKEFLRLIKELKSKLF